MLNIIIDRTAPTVSFTNADPVTVTGTTDVGTTVKVTIDGATPVDATIKGHATGFLAQATLDSTSNLLLLYSKITQGTFRVLVLMPYYLHQFYHQHLRLPRYSGL